MHNQSFACDKTAMASKASKDLVIIPKFMLERMQKQQSNGKGLPSSHFSNSSKPTFKKLNRWWVSQEGKKPVELLVKPEAPWFDQLEELGAEEQQMSSQKAVQVLEQISAQVEQHYNAEVDFYAQHLASLGGTSDQKWLANVIESGTWSDRVAALTLRIQESPFHNLKPLDILIQMAEKNDPRVATLAIEALRDLVVSNLLPNRHLRTFTESQALLLHSRMTLKQGMLLWYEAALKARVSKIVQAIETCLQSNYTNFRITALETAEFLLSKKPEQEGRLLEMLVNKTGDSDGKVNSKAFDMLKKLLVEHPVMKVVVIKEVRNFIYRANSKLPAIYRCVCFLGTLKHRHNEHKAVLELAECYLSLFDRALEAKEEGNRLLAALLTGINRLFPLLQDVSSLFPYLDPIFKLIHTSPSWATVTQSLTLIANCVLSTSSVSSLQQKLDFEQGVRPEDESSHSRLARRYYRALYSTLLSDQAVSNRKEKEYLNLLFRSIKHDPVEIRAMAFVKRLALCALNAQPCVAAALLFIISEVLQARPALKVMLSKADSTSVVTSAKTDDTDGDDNGSVSMQTHQTAAEHHLLGSFDAMKREPEFACVGGKPPALHEIAALRYHFHPSVRAFAMALLEPPEHGISYQGDPLEEFSLMAFLNRFAYKNPKEKVMDSLRRKQAEEGPVNQQMEELVRATGDVIVAPEKHFFYKYFGERQILQSQGKSKSATRRKQKEGDDDSMDFNDDDAEEDDEEEIDRFADELAEGLMKADAAGRKEFFDEDDEDMDFDDTAGDGEEDGEDGDDGDDDDDERVQLMAYESSGDEDEPPAASKKSGKAKGKGKKARAVEMDDDSDDDDDDAGEFLDFEDFKANGNSKKGKSGKDSGKASKKRKHHDDEVDGGMEGDFADASLYEDQMEENVERFAFKPGKEEPAENDRRQKFDRKRKPWAKRQRK